MKLVLLNRKGMPGGGLLALVSYGSQNVILNSNPEFTYFYKVFKRYSHFSMENTTIPLDGPNELFFDQPIKVRAKLPRVADLVTNLMFLFDLPDIYSKYLTPTHERSAQYEFQWNRFIGAHIISNIGFYVGGTKIQEFDSDYIISKAFTDYDEDTFKKFQNLTGDVPELTNPSKGIHAGGLTGTGYPSVVRNTNTLQQANQPSILGQTLYVPLPLWFNESPGKALPLVGLQYHECEIQLTLRPIQELYTILDPVGYRVRPGYRVEQPYNPNDPAEVSQPKFISYHDPSGNFSAFAVDIGQTPPLLNTWFLNPRLEANYVYLTDSERKIFATTPLTYIVSQITTLPFPNIYSRQLVDLDISNPCTRLIVLPRRSDVYNYQNQNVNYTNWWQYPKKPWVSTPGAKIPQNIVISSGLFIPNTQVSILNTLRVLLDGNELQEEKPVSYYTKVVPFTSLKGGSQKESTFLPIVNLSLTSPSDQPSGSVNASRIRLFQLDINPWSLPTTFNGPNYVYDITVFAETLNFFVIESGYGGLKYAL